MARHLRLGRDGEEMAARHLRSQGYGIVARNFRCRAGEIDIVAAKGDVLVFVEVKTRVTDRWGSPAEAVDFRKQQRLRRIAAAWLAEHRSRHSEMRFDVISLLYNDGRPQLEHIPNAF